ncbi:LysR family transcriptional regulator [Kitasatospora sp. NPDC048365]|uniref:LysR family transcriptional regulator n=1 Tax=Kitasatospora sp. NPDC048365 TaxID=3364050 RepID=UPI0037249F8C
MDPQQLRTFVAVAHLASFSEAARELGYTQSAVSQQIAALEGDVGVALLERRPVRVTAAGERLLEHAGSLLLRLDAARADVRRVVGVSGGRVVIGAAGATVTAAVAQALAAVRARYPRVEVRITQVARAAVAAQVATGVVDVGLVDGVAAPSDPLALGDVGPLRTVAVAEEPLAVLMPAGHPLAGRKGLALADLADARWLDAPDVAMELDRLRAVAGPGFRAAARYEGGEVRGLLALVAAGHGLALVPRPSAGGAGVAAVPLRSPRLVHRTELVHGALAEGPVALLVETLTGR